MKHRKFPSFADAKAYCESKGKLTYYGREGTFERPFYVYSLEFEGISYHVWIYEDGLLEVRE